MWHVKVYLELLPVEECDVLGREYKRREYSYKTVCISFVTQKIILYVKMRLSSLIFIYVYIKYIWYIYTYFTCICICICTTEIIIFKNTVVCVCVLLLGWGSKRSAIMVLQSLCISCPRHSKLSQPESLSDHVDRTNIRHIGWVLVKPSVDI